MNGFPSGSNTPDNDRIHRSNADNKQGLKSPNNQGSIDKMEYKENL